MADEKSLDQLQAELNEADIKTSKLEKANADLQAEISIHAEENAGLKEQLEAHTRAAAELAKENEALKNKVAELEAEITEATEKITELSVPSFEYEGETYEILAPKATVPNHGQVTAADIVATPELQAVLVTKNSGLIRKKI